MKTTKRIKFYEQMIKSVCLATWGTLQFKINGHDVDLTVRPQIKYADLPKKNLTSMFLIPTPSSWKKSSATTK